MKYYNFIIFLKFIYLACMLFESILDFIGACINVSCPVAVLYSLAIGEGQWSRGRVYFSESGGLWFESLSRHPQVRRRSSALSRLNY